MASLISKPDPWGSEGIRQAREDDPDLKPIVGIGNRFKELPNKRQS